MKSSTSALLLIVPAVGACASMKDSVVVPQPIPASRPAAETAVIVAEPAPQDPVPAATPVEKSGMNPSELDIWNDPGFQKRFIESYVAQTDVEPRLTADETEVMQEVLSLIAADQRDQAAELLRENQGETASATVDYFLGNLHFQEDRLEEAAAAFEVAVEKFPNFLRAWQNLGVVYYRLGEFGRTIPAHTRVLELGAGNSDTYGLLGYAHASVGNHIAAESAFRMAVLLDANTLEWQEGLVITFFKQGRYSEAASFCDTLIQENPESVKLWLLQANAFIGLEKPLQAAENYELVDKLGGSTPESLLNLGDIYVNQQLFDLGVDAYIRALEMEPETELDRPLLAARSLTRLGAFDETERLVIRIESLKGSRIENEDRKKLLKLRALIAVSRGAGDDEARVLEEIVALDPLDGEALMLLGEHALRGGDLEQSIFYFERAAAIEAFEADAKARHGQILVGESRYKEAIPLLKRAQQLKYRDNIQRYLEQVERIAQSR